MCRNIRTLYNYDPPVSEEEIRAAALQFVRKISGFNRPSKANEAAFSAAVDDIARISDRLLGSLASNAPPRIVRTRWHGRRRAVRNGLAPEEAVSAERCDHDVPRRARASTNTPARSSSGALPAKPSTKPSRGSGRTLKCDTQQRCCYIGDCACAHTRGEPRDQVHARFWRGDVQNIAHLSPEGRPRRHPGGPDTRIGIGNDRRNLRRTP